MVEDRKVIYDDRIPHLKKLRKKKNHNKLFILLIFLFLLIITSILYLQSSYSKLNQIHINGHRLLSEQRIMDQADLWIGMSYFNIGIKSVEELLVRLPEVKSVQVTRELPNNLVIVIEEHDVQALWLEDEQLIPVIEGGVILYQSSWNGQMGMYPILSHWPHKDGLVELTSQLVILPDEVTRSISEIILKPNTADPYRLQLFMTDGFEVWTTIRKFSENMVWYPQLVNQAKTEEIYEGIFHLFDGKWYENPDYVEEEDLEEDDLEENDQEEGIY